MRKAELEQRVGDLNQRVAILEAQVAALIAMLHTHVRLNGRAHTEPSTHERETASWKSSP